MHARFEIAVAGQHARGDQIILRHRFLNRRGQGTGVADARRATVADEVEPQRIEIPLQPRLREVITHDARAWRERGFHVRGNFQPTLDGLLREQPCAEHHCRVRCVRATRDRRDDHRAVADFIFAIMRREHGGNVAGGRMLVTHLGLAGLDVVLVEPVRLVRRGGRCERSELDGDTFREVGGAFAVAGLSDGFCQDFDELVL